VAVNRITVAEWKKLAGKGEAVKPVIRGFAGCCSPEVSWESVHSLPVVGPSMTTVRIKGLRLISELNRREHHMVTHRRKKAQQQIVHLAFVDSHAAEIWQPPMLVTITRFGAGRLDPTENLPSCGKWVVDQLAKEFSVNDGRDDLIKYEVAQRKCGRGEYSVEIKFQSLPGRKSA
jgi:hypothetical protein